MHGVGAVGDDDAIGFWEDGLDCVSHCFPVVCHGIFAHHAHDFNRFEVGDLCKFGAHGNEVLRAIVAGDSSCAIVDARRDCAAGGENGNGGEVVVVGECCFFWEGCLVFFKECFFLDFFGFDANVVAAGEFEDRDIVGQEFRAG